VGQTRIVPDHISLYPQTGQVAPFAGATRNLCDRKEVTLGDQTGAIAKFFVYTSTHIASKFTGGITDDFTSEFDPFHRSSVRNLLRQICQFPSRIGQALKSPACTPITGAPTTA